MKFFTPTAEVNLCGHATIATFYLLGNKQIIQPGKFKQETKAGVLEIEIMQDGSVLMDQNLPQFLDKIDKKIIAESLSISTEIIMDDLPIQIVSTGLKDIFVPIRSLDQLMRIEPDFEKVRNISKRFDVIGYHLGSCPVNSLNYVTIF